ncbi:peptide deformylase [bacterium DOLZORAL124_38_8]|nr:MAG: peptide deformylase [bacterium DOLZORAL124_38_8]
MMEIITGADTKILRTVCQKVTSFDDELKNTAKEMVETMLGDQEGNVTGIGLAANQVGINKRIIIVTFNLESRKNQKIVTMVNPEIIETSQQTVSMEEGCLSLPETFGNVTRPKKVKAKWQNLEGNWCEKKLDGWDARVFLHELDHLNGKLFIDYLEKN